MSNSPKQQAVFEQFAKIGIIPVVVLNDASDAVELGKCLMQGLPAAEVTFRTAAAEESIRIMSETYPDLLVGAGTVLSVDQARRAVNAGARFIVSPGFDPEVVSYCLDHDIPVCPGTQSPSEMIAAMKMGLDHVKFFPAEPSGGLPMIKAITSALVDLRIMPTGGINPSNVRDYLQCEKIFCAGGSWMVKGDLIKAHDWDKITSLVKEAAAIVKEVRG
ncbi:MAG: bifunctional 4-hydroxy-2-oxoglutarate aldolase/2-dehydro-3-deoxy-phosphogluconate aldolase [Lachnospiraceae bacterium]|nr:bifunctional 4-hydroxy-2-oxoglutarate aldolase/2-dehydro-3-deoxy-phosphogluconate aldolase [Lachnospiraceae bacterium]